MSLLLRIFLSLEKIFGTKFLADIAWGIAIKIENDEIKVGDIVTFTKKAKYCFAKERKKTKGKVKKIIKKALYPYYIEILNNDGCFSKKTNYVFTRKEIKKIKREKIRA